MACEIAWPCALRPVSQGLNHLALVSLQPERLAQFYESALDLPRLRSADDDGGRLSIWLQLGAGAVLMIERASAPGDRAQPPGAPRSAALAGPASSDGEGFFVRTPGLFLFALSVANADRARFAQRLEALGSPVEARSNFSDYYRDPDGNRFALSCFDPDLFLQRERDKKESN